MEAVFPVVRGRCVARSFRAGVQKTRLAVPDDLWESVPKSGAVSSRTESQGLAIISSSDNHESRPGNPTTTGVFAPYDTENATSGTRDRTGDLEFMNPTQHLHVASI